MFLKQCSFKAEHESCSEEIMCWDNPFPLRCCWKLFIVSAVSSSAFNEKGGQLKPWPGNSVEMWISFGQMKNSLFVATTSQLMAGFLLSLLTFVPVSSLLCHKFQKTKKVHKCNTYFNKSWNQVSHLSIFEKWEICVSSIYHISFTIIDKS